MKSRLKMKGRVYELVQSGRMWSMKAINLTRDYQWNEFDKLSIL